MKEQHSIQLTKDEAISLFCFSGYDPSSLLHEKKSLLNSENHEYFMYDLWTMILIIKIFLNYKSEDVRYFVQSLCCNFIDNIYKNSTTTVSVKDFKFLIRVILKYRNLTDYKQIDDVELDKSLVESIRQNLFKLKAIDSYQQLLF